AVNISLGNGRYFDQASCDAANLSRKAAIDNLRAAGIATVAAAGNDVHRDSLIAPACISSAVSVGATNKADLIASFSNTAPFLSLLAPGAGIVSSVPGSGVSVGTTSGASMAAPHVAAASAPRKWARRSAAMADAIRARPSAVVP